MNIEAITALAKGAESPESRQQPEQPDAADPADVATFGNALRSNDGYAPTDERPPFAKPGTGIPMVGVVALGPSQQSQSTGDGNGLEAVVELGKNPVKGEPLGSAGG